MSDFPLEFPRAVNVLWSEHVAVGRNRWYHFGVGAHFFFVYVSGDWDVHWGYGILTYSHVFVGAVLWFPCFC